MNLQKKKTQYFFWKIYQTKACIISCKILIMQFLENLIELTKIIAIAVWECSSKINHVISGRILYFWMNLRGTPGWIYCKVSRRLPKKNKIIPGIIYGAISEIIFGVFLVVVVLKMPQNIIDKLFEEFLKDFSENFEHEFLEPWNKPL